MTNKLKKGLRTHISRSHSNLHLCNRDSYFKPNTRKTKPFILRCPSFSSLLGHTIAKSMNEQVLFTSLPWCFVTCSEWSFGFNATWVRRQNEGLWFPQSEICCLTQFHLLEQSLLSVTPEWFQSSSDGVTPDWHKCNWEQNLIPEGGWETQSLPHHCTSNWILNQFHRTSLNIDQKFGKYG